MQRSYTIDVAEDASALIDIEPLSFSSAEFSDTPGACLEERFMDITDDGDIPEACLEENFLDITDEEANIHIREAWLEENFMATMDDGDIPEAKVIEHVMYGANRDIVPLLDALFLDQVVFVPTQQPFKDNSTRKLSSVNNPRYALIAMLMSVVAAITYIIEACLQGWKGKSHLETIISAVAYTFYLQHADYPLKVSFSGQLFLL
ncbi:hypothetical protein CRYUN_Cryun16bG0099600 [Craigia yunnanensis]